MSATLGVDVGSREVKLAIMERDEIILTTKMDTIQFYIACRNGGRELDISRLSALSSAPVHMRKSWPLGMDGTI